jgi:hypothetical protein
MAVQRLFENGNSDHRNVTKLIKLNTTRKVFFLNVFSNYK